MPGRRRHPGNKDAEQEDATQGKLPRGKWTGSVGDITIAARGEIARLTSSLCSPPSLLLLLHLLLLLGFSEEGGDEVNTISISEALTLLREKLDDPDRPSGAAAKDGANPVLQKTMEYLDTFSRYKDLDTVRQLRT